MNVIKQFPPPFVYLYLLIIIPKFQKITAIKKTLSPASIYSIFSLLQSFFFQLVLETDQQEYINFSVSSTEFLIDISSTLFKAAILASTKDLVSSES